MELLPLHRYPEFKEDSVDVLNEEWPRSKSARLHMLEKSNDSLPYSLVLLENEEVLGHSRLCKVHGVEKACFVESVVIRKALRGKGYGRILMEKTEGSAKELGYNTVYLTTHDKQDFYEHLGYEFCDPVVSLGGASTLLSPAQLDRLFGSVCDKNRSEASADGLKSKAQKDAENELTKTMTNSDSLSNLHELSTDDTLEGNPNPGIACHVSVDSDVPATPVVVPPAEPASCPIPDAPVPPPPPALPALSSAKTVTRCGQIYWMKKQL